jgi:heat shock protein HtpX
MHMRQTFRDLIAANKRKSKLLVAGFAVLVIVFAMVLGAAVVVLAGDNVDAASALQLGALSGAGAAVTCFALMSLGYFQGDRFILSVSGAHPMERAQDPQLYNVVEEMAIAAGVPMPQVYLIDDDAPNAFATGRDPEHASVAITRGLRTKLTREELQGVIAHENVARPQL